MDFLTFVAGMSSGVVFVVYLGPDTQEQNFL